MIDSSLREDITVGSLAGGIIAFFVGLGLAGATALGVVQQQQSAGEEPVKAGAVSYGSNGG